MSREPPMPPAVASAVHATWAKAQSHWAPFLLLAPPVHDPKGKDIARIDLATRQVALNGDTIVKHKVVDCVEAILAHEVGHHVRYPGTLAVSARLQLLGRQLVPVEIYPLVNLFMDLLINAELEPRLRDDLVRVYRSFQSDPGWGHDPAFLFYMAIYEELWRLRPGVLVGDGPAAEIARRFPDYRADAHVVAQDVFRIGPNVYTQFLYFLSVLIRYLDLSEEAARKGGDPWRCAHGQPSPEDWADALTPSAAEREAIERARAEGWIEEEQAKRLSEPDSMDRRLAALPGQGGHDAEQVPEIMAAYYRRLAERHLVAPPPEMVLGEAIVPTTLEDWDIGDPLAEIDWPATLRLKGDRLGGIAPLRRERIAEQEGADVPMWHRDVEIYLDVSGSMPDPRHSVNAMTLAALVLAAGAIRAGGSARALLYSGDQVRFWSWCRSEAEMSRFLMHYIGGGTEFPFRTLEESVAECGARRPVRVILTDSDFDHNYGKDPRNARILADAARHSEPLVLMLHHPPQPSVGRYRGVGAEVVAIEDLDDFPAMAATLARALFEGARR